METRLSTDSKLFRKRPFRKELHSNVIITSERRPLDVRRSPVRAGRKQTTVESQRRCYKFRSCAAAVVGGGSIWFVSTRQMFVFADITGASIPAWPANPLDVGSSKCTQPIRSQRRACRHRPKVQQTKLIIKAEYKLLAV